MNKDTIYIEPADDITDIIAKIKDSPQKVVALVPPKKLGVLASAINIKLIAKVAKANSKAVVLVTDNPSLMKLCASVELPVAETLQSRPAIPTADDIATAETTGEKLTIAEEAEEAAARDAKEELAKEFTAEPESAAEIFDEPAADGTIDSAEIEDQLAEDAAKDITVPTDGAIEINESDTAESADAKDAAADQSEKKVPNFKKARKWIIAGVIAAIAIAAGLVWALVIAPNADIIVSVGTTSANFSENVSFTNNRDEEDATAGKFYLETLEYKETLSAPLTATAEKNIGDKASGKVEISYTFKSSTNTSVTIPANSSFTQGGLKYTNAEKATLAAPSTCTLADLADGKCVASISVTVTATDPGEKYNCDKNMSWSSNVNGVTVTNSAAITGGSDKTVKVLQQSDIDTAAKELKKLSETEAKAILTEQLSSGYILIDSSYKATASELATSAKLGEELSEDTNVEQEITYTIYAVDETKVEEFIRAKANLGSDQKIYSLGDPYIERFTTTDDSITGKLKTSYKVGPEITVEDIIEKVKGKKTGEAYAKLQSINGVKSVKIDATFNNIPDDVNKIHVQLEVEQ